MLWLQLAILVLVACVQGGNAKVAPRDIGCEARCEQRAGKCVEASEDCKSGNVISMECDKGETCSKCCIKSKGEDGSPKLKSDKGNSDGQVKNNKTKLRKKPNSGSKRPGPKKDGNKKSDRKVNQDGPKKSLKKNKNKKENKNKNKKVKNKGSGKRKANRENSKGNRKLGEDGSSKSKSDKGNSDGQVKNNKKKLRKKPNSGSKRPGPKKDSNKKSGRKVKQDGPKKALKNKKVKNKGSGKKKTNGENTKGNRKLECDIKCADGNCVKNKMKCDKVNDCGDNDDTDEQGCNFVPELTCHRCKTWDTGNVGAKFDPDCGKTGYSNHTDKADTSDPYIGCATKVYKNGDFVRLFESWQTNDQMGSCYEGTDYKNGGPEYEYTRCWCSGANCNTNACEECLKK